jgi:hypothetical protein
MSIKTCNTSITQNPSPNRRVGKLSGLEESFQQLELFPLPKPLSKQHQKPQVSSVPGIPATTRRRYRVTIGDRVVASHLDIDDALEVVANCAAVTEVDA